ncbi:regulator of G-protein signaling 12b isoform X1 [Scleropages formosus]|uniref:regulator of G-protein signaling 12b isoform X1 n=1 Tax=Scleropages formosus TaxID=113540 RepID=UPI0010FA8461|nr:regulator of G-protein signaling 12 isoform X1 [Scleropages formosus]XP_029114712.1 regulator of G-protein signaling 12 isoform X1 [Scleropages formosus]
MFRQAETGKRRLNLQAVTRVRSVEVARGRTGYGFTLSGQAPCVLSCVLRGSPADYVGLRSGDQVLSVNEINVSKASHEDVVKLIGRCSGVLHLVVAECRGHLDSCSSDEELGLHDAKNHWLKPKVDSKTLGINRAERVVAEMQSGGIFNMIFENSSHSSSSSEKAAAPKARPLSEPDCSHRARSHSSKSNPDLLSEEEMARVLNDDSVFVEMFENQDDFALDASILNVGMIVGYLGSIELASTSSNLENDSLQAIRGCMRRLRAEQKIHSLVMMKIMHDCIQLCNDKGTILATYPAEKLAFSAVCPDDRRFFGLVTMQVSDDHNLVREEDGGLRTSCHVFIVDPELCHHKIHQGIARRFGFECTPDPDTNGCLEFPPTSQPLLQFVSVLYRDMGESIEGMRARAFLDGDADGQQNNSTSSNSDSGIGNFLPEEKNNRVLLVDLGSNPGRHVPNGLWENPPARTPGQPTAHWNGYRYDHLSELGHPDPSQLSGRHLGPAGRMEVPAPPPRAHYPHAKKTGVAGAAQGGGQRWLPVHVLRDWQQGISSDQESYAESTDGWSSANCSTLPPPMSKIPADRYRAAGEIAQPSRLTAQKDEWAKKLFGADKAFRDHQHGRRSKDEEKKEKGSRFGSVAVGLPQPPQRSSAKRSLSRFKRLSLARSLDDLESTAVSDGELTGVDLKGCGSENSLSSNTSLPSVQSHRRHTERRVASWAVCFERLLQDPVGVRYFSEFLKKEFSEENILFWQACEFFSHVPENDKKQLSQRAREIYNSFLSSKATTPVNIDSQAQLADDILNAPRPDMFKEQQLQIFNLMKFDSYTRFLKSFLYQECMLAEVEGRSLPDPQQVPSSPTSKHSTSSDRSNLSTPKKDDKKSKSGRSLNDDSRDDHGDKKKGSFFSWSRNRSFGKGPKKRDLGDFSYNFSGSNGRRESQGSLSSGASVELGTPNAGGKTEGDASRNSTSQRQCTVNLPDGTCCNVPVRPGVSVREVLMGLCEKLSINLAAVDLFLVGGEKPLVLDQDCMTLSSRDLRLEKRTLFRLDLVPINRSVGLKAKPTKPVTEVLRPVVAKYGLHLNDLVAKISGEKDPLDLGLPISNLDGLRVVLDVADHTTGKDKQKLVSPKGHTAPVMPGGPSTGDEKSAGRARGENGKAAREARQVRHDESVEKVEKRKQKKINIDEAEEFFELISKAQSNRADDQRGLLNKEDLVLPDFLRLAPEPACSTPQHAQENGGGPGRAHRSALSASHQSQSLDSTLTGSDTKEPLANRRALLPPGGSRAKPPFTTPLPPVPYAADSSWCGETAVRTVDDDNVADLTLVGEGDINSPNSTLLPPTLKSTSQQGRVLEASLTSQSPCHNTEGSYVDVRSSSGISGV